MSRKLLTPNYLRSCSKEISYRILVSAHSMCDFAVRKLMTTCGFYDNWLELRSALATVVFELNLRSVAISLAPNYIFLLGKWKITVGIVCSVEILNY